MKILLAQPANIRFQWELEVLLTNIQSLSALPVVVLFLLESPLSAETVEFIGAKYPAVEVHSYNDERTMMNYPATARPYLIYRYLKEDPAREQEDYFQIDSDVLFREMLDFSAMPLEGKVCWGSDCEGYIGYDYLMSRKQGPMIVDKFSEILHIPVEKIRKTPGIGAQFYYSKPTAGLWWHIWKDSEILYDFLWPISSDIQKWTAEMWAQLYNFLKFGWEIKVSPELDFCRPYDPLSKWEAVKILHNAGVTPELSSKLFFKGAYQYKSPLGKNFDYVDPKKVSFRYIEAIRKVAHNTNNV